MWRLIDDFAVSWIGKSEDKSMEAPDKKSPETPWEVWAHGHSPRSYGSRTIKKGKVPIKQRVPEIFQAIDLGRQVQIKSDHRFRGAIFTISIIGIFEIKGGANSQNAIS
jgi:hypothetical protein